MAPLAGKHSCYRPPGFMRVKNTLYQHQNFSAPAFNRALQKAKYRVLAGTTRGGDSSGQLL